MMMVLVLLAQIKLLLMVIFDWGENVQYMTANDGGDTMMNLTQMIQTSGYLIIQ